MVATHDGEQAPCMWEDPFLHLLHPSAEHADRNIVFRFAGSGTSMATDAFPVVDDKSKFHLFLILLPAACRTHGTDASLVMAATGHRCCPRPPEHPRNRFVSKNAGATVFNSTKRVAIEGFFRHYGWVNMRNYRFACSDNCHFLKKTEDQPPGRDLLARIPLHTKLFLSASVIFLTFARFSY
jgi:hypothetical protein